MSLHYFSNFFVGVACIISLIEMNWFDRFYVNIDETYDGVFVYAIQASKMDQNFYYGAKYGDTLNPVNLVPPGAYFSSASDGTVTKIFGGTSHPAKIPQDYFQLSMAIGYAQNTHGFEPRSMVLDDNGSSSLEYSFDTSVAPFLILAHTNEYYPNRFKTLRFKTSDGTIWLIRVQCFDPINTEGP